MIEKTWEEPPSLSQLYCNNNTVKPCTEPRADGGHAEVGRETISPIPVDTFLPRIHANEQWLRERHAPKRAERRACGPVAWPNECQGGSCEDPSSRLLPRGGNGCRGVAAVTLLARRIGDHHVCGAACFHGRTDNISPEKGLLKNGPPAAQTGAILRLRRLLGVSIADSRIFTAGDFDDQEMVLALDMNGEAVVESVNGRAGPAPREPRPADGVYQMTPGRWQLRRTVEPIWAVDLKASSTASTASGALPKRGHRGATG